MVEDAEAVTAISNGRALSAASSPTRVRVWGVIGLLAQVTFTIGWLAADTWQGPHYSAVHYSISDETAVRLRTPGS